MMVFKHCHVVTITIYRGNTILSIYFIVSVVVILNVIIVIFIFFQKFTMTVKSNELCNFEWRRDSYIYVYVEKKHAKQRRTEKRFIYIFFFRPKS